MTRRTLLLLAAIVASACAGGATDPGTPGVPVLGAWRYVGAQGSPEIADLVGTLAFTQQTGAQVGGTLDFVARDARGLQRRVAGPVGGRTVDSTTVDFELRLDAVSRRHVGRVRGDSLVGSWVETPNAGGAPTASGTFRAARDR